MQSSLLNSCSGDCASAAWPSGGGRSLDSSALSSVSDTIMHRAPSMAHPSADRSTERNDPTNRAKPKAKPKPPPRGKAKATPLDTTSRLIKAAAVRHPAPCRLWPTAQRCSPLAFLTGMSEPLTSEAEALPKRAVLIAVLKHCATPNLDSHEPRSLAETRLLDGAVQLTPGFGVAQRFSAAISSHHFRRL